MKNLALIALAAVTLPAFSQTTLEDSLVRHWKTSGVFTLEVAEAMPSESYSFKPVPEEMSFGQVMLHIGSANLGACSLASGMKRPEMPADVAQAVKENRVDVDKTVAIKYLKQTFAFCDDAVASMTPAKLDAVVGGNRKMTGFEWLWSYFTHTAHHRGQAEVYLRMKGIKPPDYKF
jgi:uncharacterized damage-inducible protein DinB